MLDGQVSLCSLTLLSEGPSGQSHPSCQKEGIKWLLGMVISKKRDGILLCFPSSG